MDLDFCALEFHAVLTVTRWCPKPPFFELLNLAVIYRLTSHNSETSEFKTGLLLLWVEDRIAIAGGQRGPTKPSASVPRLHGSTVGIPLQVALSFLRAISLPLYNLWNLTHPQRGWAE